MVTAKRSAFASSAYVLRHPTMTWLTEQFIDDGNQRINWDKLCEQARRLSGGEQTMVDIALSIWNGGVGGRPSVGEMLRDLDEAAWDRVLEALTALKPAPGMRRAHEIADEAIGLFIEAFERRAGLGLTTESGNVHFAEEARREAVDEIREGFAVREEDLGPLPDPVEPELPWATIYRRGQGDYEVCRPDGSHILWAQTEDSGVEYAEREGFIVVTHLKAEQLRHQKKATIKKSEARRVMT